ncbi:hypothetical protein ACFQ6E_38755 [Streptomyces sp. NPDC056462]|uniref:hypothetical protein n=1 Tax=Streptomyces sp. NPDC056462 TaxID=3345826 RepID=UPI0036BE416E
MVIDRYGDYVVIFDPDTDAVPVFTQRYSGYEDPRGAYLHVLHVRPSGDPCAGR